MEFALCYISWIWRHFLHCYFRCPDADQKIFNENNMFVRNGKGDVTTAQTGLVPIPKFGNSPNIFLHCNIILCTAANIDLCKPVSPVILLYWATPEGRNMDSPLQCVKRRNTGSRLQCVKNWVPFTMRKKMQYWVSLTMCKKRQHWVPLTMQHWVLLTMLKKMPHWVPVTKMQHWVLLTMRKKTQHWVLLTLNKKMQHWVPLTLSKRCNMSPSYNV